MSERTFFTYVGPDWAGRIGTKAPKTTEFMYHLDIIYSSGRSVVYTYFTRGDAEDAIKKILESADIVFWYEIRRKVLK